MGALIDGKKIADNLKHSLKDEVHRLKKAGTHPKLTVILVGEDPASSIYVRNKEKAARAIGIESFVEKYPAEMSEDELLDRIIALNRDDDNHGILVQLPLPKHINEDNILNAIDPEKDVDGFHPVNIGKLVTGQPCLRPCTPSGIMHLIESTGIDLKGKSAVVLGRSNIVGKPIALMLLEKDATVTICHSKTADLSERIAGADILVAAVGRAGFVKGELVKQGSIVIDVGINRTEEGGICGDVEFEEAKTRAAFITPVPGGVGPMTIAMLMKNTVEAAKNIG